MKFVYAEGATPFNQDEAQNLIPQHITTQGQLNEWEQANIIKAQRWLFSRRRKDILTVKFIQTLHKQMFNETWRWAGTFRRYQTNVGVAAYEIEVALNMLCGDIEFCLKNHSYPVDETAARFHHRLVQIHPFPNGNGRHARLMTDVLLHNLHQPKFTWGRENLTSASGTRRKYIDSLRSADQGDITLLLEFVRS